MRLDKFLKVSRLIKQRSVAKWACDAGRISILGRKAKAGTAVRVGDELTINLRDRTLLVRVLETPEGNVSKERAPTIYEVVEEYHGADI
jgi:ribosomal 50S subunit-recycling heat shock protein